MSTTLASGYEPKDFETRLYTAWETSGVFTPQGDGPAYSILLPPPNVTGTLHMGHAFQHTLQDALVRYHRMRGDKTLWQMGTDHAGIATEMVVSRNLQLAGEGETRDSLGREKFIDKVWEWKTQSGDTIERQMRRLGTSGDWSRSVFTMDEGPSNAVIEAFVRLYEQGLIYRGQRLVNWDPVLKTAISDLEVVSEEEDGFLWSIRYNVIDPPHGAPDHVVVATTRPETMLGDTAVMVHPEDERYSALIGLRVRLPLTNREIPIIADDYVDREFGTGVVKVTPAHDFNDYAVGLRHQLPMVNIFTPDAKIKSSFLQNFSVANTANEALPTLVTRNSTGMALNYQSGFEELPKKYHGLDRYEARKVVLADLEAAELLIETKPHKLQVPRGDRTGQVIEPYLTDQWFVKMDTFAQRGLELVDNGSVKFVPPNWINTYRHWMENIQDWCISRQLWWGHRIPAWYDDAGTVYVARTEAEAQAKAAAATSNAGAAEAATLRRDNDVLETWFSSGLWPISTMGWPDTDAMQHRGFADYVPSSVLVTGFDIIFFWVARMIMMTDHFVGQDKPQASDAQRVPFKDVYITGLVRDKDGQKMSKSKGNILDPLDIIDGIDLDTLVKKRTTGLMKPTDAPKIEKNTRKEFPDGIAAHGADALRFTMCALAGPGRDIKFDMARCEGYKNFCNKLWNATRFVLMNTEGFTASGAPQPQTPAEHWILHELASVADEVIGYFGRTPQEQAQRAEDDIENKYRFDLAAKSLYEFAWNVYCDDFVEAAKQALQSDGAAANSTRHTLLYVLESILRLLHPIIPFITEELWQNVAPKLGIDGNTLSLQPYPEPVFNALSANAANDFQGALHAAHQIRALRSRMGIPSLKRVPLLVECESDHLDFVHRHSETWKFLAKLDSVRVLAANETSPPSMMLPYGEIKFHIPLEGLVDLDAERARLDKEIKRIAGEKAKSAGKLSSETFVQNAPAAVVEQERQRLVDWTTQHTALMEQRARL